MCDSLKNFNGIYTIYIQKILGFDYRINSSFGQLICICPVF